MKRLYQLPKAELMLIEAQDVITASANSLLNIKKESGGGDKMTWADGFLQ